MASGTAIRMSALLACAASAVVGVMFGSVYALGMSLLTNYYVNIPVGLLIGGVAGGIVGQVASNDKVSKLSLVACGALITVIVSGFVSYFFWLFLLCTSDI